MFDVYSKDCAGCDEELSSIDVYVRPVKLEGANRRTLLTTETRHGRPSSQLEDVVCSPL